MSQQTLLEPPQAQPTEQVAQPPIPPAEIRPATPHVGRRSVFVLFVGLAILVLSASNPTPIKAAWVEFERIIFLKSDPLPASPPKLSDHEIDALSAMAPQQRAELLMERSINHYGGAIERLDKDVLGCYGQLEVQNGTGRRAAQYRHKFK